MSDLIDRQATIDTLDKHLRTTDVPVSYPGIISALTEWLNELPSAQADSKELSGTHKALDTVSRQAVIEAINKIFPADPMRDDYTQGITCGAALANIYVAQLPSAQPEERTEERTETHACDYISRQDAVEAIENIDWYHLRDGVMVHGANSKEDEPLYKAEDVYKVLNDMPSAQPDIIRCKDCKYSDTDNTLGVMCCWRLSYHEASEDGFCSWAERRTDV